MKKDNMNKIHGGDIFYADLGKMKGSVQCGKRPVLVIQNNRLNATSPKLLRLEKGVICLLI